MNASTIIASRVFIQLVTTRAPSIMLPVRYAESRLPNGVEIEVETRMEREPVALSVVQTSRGFALAADYRGDSVEIALDSAAPFSKAESIRCAREVDDFLVAEWKREAREIIAARASKGGAE